MKLTNISQRQRVLYLSFLLVTILAFVLYWARFQGAGAKIHLIDKNLPPSLTHLFGTDWLGRDMFTRTMLGLKHSLLVGLLGSSLSIVMGLLAAAFAQMSKVTSYIVDWLVHLFMSVPYIVLIIFVSMIFARGTWTTATAIALAHWPSFARLVQTEINDHLNFDYILVSSKLGKSRAWILIHHLLPHVWPVFLVGFTLNLPHAIISESTITFMGFGVEPHEPSIGVILSESLQYLTQGHWWLMVCPGVSLLVIVIIVQQIGEYLKRLYMPQHYQE